MDVAAAPRPTLPQRKWRKRAAAGAPLGAGILAALSALSTSLALAASLALALLPGTTQAAALPRPVVRAFLDAQVPLANVSVVVQRVGASRPLVAHNAQRTRVPASVMKLVTTFAALEILGPDHRFRTEAFLRGRLEGGTLDGDLVLKGHGDPKITVEQWQSLMGALRAAGLDTIRGDLVLDRSDFRLPPHDPASFDGEPLKPYNVGPDALLVNFKSVKFAFAPAADGAGVDIAMEPAMPEVALGNHASLDPVAACGDWRGALGAAFLDRRNAAAAQFQGRYAQDCGDREWYVALLDHPHYVHGIFTWAFNAAGGHFAGGMREGAAPAGATPFAVLESPPLYDIVRDVNKLSNNVMASQLFLAIAAARMPLPATFDKAAVAVRRWLDAKKLAMPELAIHNGSGLSRDDRLSAASLARLLAAADASPVRDAFESSLAIAAIDGTVERRFRNGTVAGQALLKTGSLEGVRSLAGYVTDAGGQRWIVAAIVNDPHAAQARDALDGLVQWVYANAARYTRGP